MARKKKKAKRAYDNSARAKKVEETQKLIIETLVKILVERGGGEPTFEEIADRAGISVRSVYRLFESKEALQIQTNLYLAGYLKSSFEQIEALNVAGFAKNAYVLFDKYEGLMKAYLFSPFGQETRHLFRVRLNEMLSAHIATEKNITLSAEQKKKVAIIVSLINAKIWHDIRTDHGYTGIEIGESVEWAITALLDAL